MNKPLSKAARRKIAREANYKIYRKLIDYLTGPKWSQTKYQINDIRSTTNAFGIIKIDTGFVGYEICIYFYVSSIHIYMKRKTHAGCIEKIDYTYFDFDKDYSDLPDDTEDYIFRTKTFLQELLRHAVYTDDYGYVYSDANISTYEDCVKPMPENFDVPFGTMNALMYEYNGRDINTIDYMIRVFKSKQFKRYRGDSK